ncbi:MAG: hypothetical protein BAJATHORv1_40253 [Candidatus Thorarchaeota archaeon]|nr:MAG: hypothetical protein BAJATHORv1_40253 [Candidatus Thorarchaeota archaeon]
MTEDTQRSLEWHLREISKAINEDQYMIMEFLSPIVDGCRAAFNVDLDRARNIHKLSEDEFQEYMDMIGDSYENLSICFKDLDGNIFSLTFEHGFTEISDECIDPDVVIIGDRDALTDLLDTDSKISPVDAIANKTKVVGTDTDTVVEALGFLAYPTLLKMAQSGIDPSSLLAEDADSVIMAAATDLITKMVKKWVDTQLSEKESA